MICANCGTNNEPGTRFCDECGAALAAACRNCGSTSNRPSAKFCATCGNPLGAQASSGGGRPVEVGAQLAAAERRLVTVLFVDLVGFTPFAEEKDPEQVRDTLDRYFAIAKLTIERHGGTIEKFIGDAVMAVWGTPTAHEDDAERAVRAALELVEDVKSLGDGIAARAGIMTGEAAVTIGAEGQGMVAGDLVNTASRLQSVAPAGAVLTNETTMRGAQAAIGFEAVGDQELKGKAAPVTAYRALRVMANRGGQSRSEQIEAPFVGRDEELRQLKEILHATSRDKRVRLVSITGPAGIGKSRLTWEFEKYVDGLVETIFWHRGRSPAYGEGITFWALGEMVRRRANLTETDDERATRAAIADTVAQVIADGDERAWVESALLTLLGVEPGHPGGRDALFAAWRVFFERIAAQGTTALVFEDLHWADNGLLDFIQHVLESSKNLPLLIITLSRPELYDRRPGWGSGQRFMTAMTLEPLDDAAMRALLNGLAPGLPERAVSEILRRADGIPLYAVEIVRMLVADGKLQLVDGAYRPVGDAIEVAVPETLRSLIASRLDALDQADRALLQDASVLGQRFTLPALAEVTGAQLETLEPRLRALVRREFVDVEIDARSPERGQYGFVQSLIREVAYGTLARRDRRSRHLAAARYFEALGEDELAGALASHYVAAYEASAEGAERDAVGAQARLALRAAGERSVQLGVHDQAVAFFMQALAVTADEREQAALLEMVADSAGVANDAGRAVGSAREAITLYERIGDDHSARRATALLGRMLIDTGAVDEAIPLLEDALAGADAGADAASTAALLATVSRGYMRTNRAIASIEAADRALTIAERENLDAIVAEALNNKGSSLAGIGRRRESAALLAAAIEIADRHGLIEIALRARNNLSVSVIGDDPRRALATLAESIEIARRLGQLSTLYWQNGSAAMYMLLIGDDWDAPTALLDESIAATAITPSELARAMATRAVLEAYRAEVPHPRFDAAVAAASDISEPQVSASLEWARALIALHERRYEEAITASESVAEHWYAYNFSALPIGIRAAMAGARRRDFDRLAAVLENDPASSPAETAGKTWVAACRAALDGDADRSVGEFRRARELFANTGFHLHEIELVMDAIELLPSADEPRRWAPDARLILERLHATPLLKRLDDVLAMTTDSGGELSYPQRTPPRATTPAGAPLP